LQDTSVFSTSDTALASWLYISNVRLLELNTDVSPARYVFEPPPEELMVEWNTGKTPCAAFYKTYRYFLVQVKKGSNGKA
jgi:hypothetical protein